MSDMPIELRYLTDLPAAAILEMDDLFHVNQSGVDRSVTLQVIANAILGFQYPVGMVHLFADSSNPNAIWPGTVWARVPGEGKTIRLAKADGSDILQQGGADNLSLTEQNLPAHTHPVKLKTSQFDHGTKQTTSNGLHSHSKSGKRQFSGNSTWIDVDDAEVSFGQRDKTTGQSGSHVHQVPIGTHDHDVEGNTEIIGSGTAINLTNSYVKLAAWYRIS